MLQIQRWTLSKGDLVLIFDLSQEEFCDQYIDGEVVFLLLGKKRAVKIHDIAMEFVLVNLLILPRRTFWACLNSRKYP